jgi:hypothetical protein
MCWPCFLAGKVRVTRNRNLGHCSQAANVAFEELQEWDVLEYRADALGKNSCGLARFIEVGTKRGDMLHTFFAIRPPSPKWLVTSSISILLRTLTFISTNTTAMHSLVQKLHNVSQPQLSVVAFFSSTALVLRICCSRSSFFSSSLSTKV